MGRFRASRDVPLPYPVPASSDENLADQTAKQPNGTPVLDSSAPLSAQQSSQLRPVASHASGTDLEAAASPAGETRQRRKTVTIESPVVRAFSRVGTALHSAHAQDFERRRRPELGQGLGKDIDEDGDDDDEDEDDDRSTDSEVDISGAALVNKRRRDGGLYDEEADSDSVESPLSGLQRRDPAGSVHDREEEDVSDHHIASGDGRKD